MTEKTTVLLLNEHGLMRDMLRHFLENPDFTLSGEAGDGATALRLAMEHKPRLLLTGLSLPDMDALTLVRYLTERLPELAVIAVTHQSEESGLLPFFAAGGHGYLNRFINESDLTDAISTVLKGEIYASHSGTQLIMSTYRIQAMLAQSGKENNSRMGTGTQGGVQVTMLSEREKQVLHLYVHGYSNKETAMLLCLSESTVITYKKRIKEKLGLNKRAELLQYAMTHNLFHACDVPILGV